MGSRGRTVPSNGWAVKERRRHSTADENVQTERAPVASPLMAIPPDEFVRRSNMRTSHGKVQPSCNRRKEGDNREPRTRDVLGGEASFETPLRGDETPILEGRPPRAIVLRGSCKKFAHFGSRPRDREKRGAGGAPLLQFRERGETRDVEEKGGRLQKVRLFGCFAKRLPLVVCQVLGNVDVDHHVQVSLPVVGLYALPL